MEQQKKLFKMKPIFCILSIQNMGKKDQFDRCNYPGFSFILKQHTAANCQTRQILEYQRKKRKFVFKNLYDNETIRQLCFNSIRTDRAVQGNFGNTLIQTRIAIFQLSRVWNTQRSTMSLIDFRTMQPFRRL